MSNAVRGDKRVSIRDCQTQTYTQTDLDQAVEENEKNHQKEPEASVTRSPTGGEDYAFEEDQPLPSCTRTEQLKKVKPQNEQSTGTQVSTRPKDCATRCPDPGGPGTGGSPDKDEDKKSGNFASYALKFAAGAAVLGIGSFIAAPVVLTGMGFTAAGIQAGSIGAYLMSASAIANGGGVAAGSAVALLQSAGAAGGIAATTCAGIGIGGAAAITGLVATGEVVVGAVRYKVKQHNSPKTKEVGTQTDPNQD
ncbi:interferon alpha-inducible protein 27-like protein 2B [Lytechinus variegatus]|uniref:interferon alpha-inducible protein 27-like protein 2B n=1 Tax=Lytechinus variegatus TaxID=7654 RepID=UPI001BB225B6|nr:interferon alpha-inducible protein 27-like protein 2B [Lytechinus variegatus]XP_041482914.1 interferon alpha-inducible protein 27-like protein 2B [Lytechinus variegatus]XP_041482915.1 interferon alpha-inducible protein 27-like protein 2B [Lytechinus variegatus]XP_041482916.1 interferon alpha-inducible protein 27-like protein 2B [Lytechinus variegatus]XP_041482917.1 interferon alpha-inducible protein 27-like protein 2B [Lytechinus variegatus]XP_041482918.1 interferon alpha-inducible protein 